MGGRHAQYKRSVYIILVLVLSFAGPGLFADGKPVVAVLDFEGSGLPPVKCSMLVDLFNQNLLETSLCHVIGRYERNKLLKGFSRSSFDGESVNDNIEAGKQLFADFIVSGRIEKISGSFVVTVRLFNTLHSRFLVTETRTFTDFSELIDSCRPLTGILLTEIGAGGAGGDNEKKILDALSPVPVRERLLLILTNGTLDRDEAVIRDVMGRCLAKLLEDKRFIPMIDYMDRSVTGIDPGAMQSLLARRDCHYGVYVTGDEAGYTVEVFETASGVIMRIPIGFPLDPEREAAILAQSLNERLPLLSEQTLAKELSEHIATEKKLEELLYTNRLLSRRVIVSFYQKLLKPVLLFSYAPCLSIVSAEADVYWYYSPVLGLGAGYGYSYNYPGTMDSRLNTIPYIHQHEIRLIPFSFRTGGGIGILINAIATLNMHDSYHIEMHVEDPVTYSGEGMVFFSKLGAQAGVFWNIGESFAVYWSGLFFNIAFPLSAGSRYPEFPDLKSWGYLSFDVGALGIICRF
ncbi:MAG: hypothetical protein JW881_01755 [Spirochaetales bacterium]|nr:hypothetical protein [Spirochaetales bacterium]